jgi:hypothetical protein
MRGPVCASWLEVLAGGACGPGEDGVSELAGFAPAGAEALAGAGAGPISGNGACGAFAAGSCADGAPGWTSEGAGVFATWFCAWASALARWGAGVAGAGIGVAATSSPCEPVLVTPVAGGSAAGAWTTGGAGLAATGADAASAVFDVLAGTRSAGAGVASAEVLATLAAVVAVAAGCPLTAGVVTATDCADGPGAGVAPVEELRLPCALACSSLAVLARLGRPVHGVLSLCASAPCCLWPSACAVRAQCSASALSKGGAPGGDPGGAPPRPPGGPEDEGGGKTATAFMRPPRRSWGGSGGKLRHSRELW